MMTQLSFITRLWRITWAERACISWMGLDLMRTKFDEIGMWMEEKMGHPFFCCDAVLDTGSRQIAIFSGCAAEMMPESWKVAGDGAPVGDAGGAVLVAPGVAPVGVALGVADEDGDVAVEDVLVHQHRVPPVRDAQVHHVRAVLAVPGLGQPVRRHAGEHPEPHRHEAPPGAGGPSVARGCSPLEISSRMSFFSTPAAYSSSRQARMDTFRWEVA